MLSAESYMPHFTAWVINHPIAALLIAFLIAFSESIIVIGGFIPGVVTMTALGILAGAGYLPIVKTILVLILGSVIGDGLSFLLGYKYSKQLTRSWLLKKRPHWIKYGKSFFAKNGGKSVLIGRFIGPLRSIIPVIAGMMKMPVGSFIFINIFASSLWTLVYILPGIILGIASNELSPKEARHAAFLVILGLISIWIFWISIKWLISKLVLIINYFLNYYLRQLAKHPKMTALLIKLSPESKARYLHITQLLVYSSLLLVFLFYLIYCIQNQYGLFNLNEPILSILQSIRANSIDAILISINELANREALTFVWLSICFIMTIKKHWKLLGYWVSLFISASLITWILHYFVLSLHPVNIRHTMAGNSFPNYSIILLVIMMGALRQAILKQYNHFIANKFNQYTYLFLLVMGIIPMFLGTHWFTDIIGSYAIGTLILNIHELIFKPQLLKQTIKTKWIIIFIISTMSLLGAQHLYNKFYEIRLRHQQQFNNYEISKQQWWNQTHAIMPIYRTNRIGKVEDRFNIQYLGNIHNLIRSLELNGWHVHHEPVFQIILKRLSGSSQYSTTPVLSNLYLNKKPEVIMILKNEKNNYIYMLRIWNANYMTTEDKKPIWLGTLIKATPINYQYSDFYNLIQDWLQNDLIKLDLKTIKARSAPNSWRVYLIRESDNE